MDDELTETRVEFRAVCAICEGSSGVVLRDQGETECEPESAKCAEDDEGESVANDPLWQVRIWPLAIDM
jgi:hypothetical protein